MKTSTTLSITCLTIFLLLNSLSAYETTQNFNYPVQVAVADFLVSDSGAVGEKYTPRIAVDGAGGFVITWVDERYGDCGDVYAQRFNSNGTKIGTNFKVNDGKPNNYYIEGRASIAFAKSGNFVITWPEIRSLDSRNYNCYAQRYSNTGNALGKNFLVSNFDTALYDNVRYVSIGFDQSDNFTILWNIFSKQTDTCHFKINRYNSSGVLISSNTDIITLFNVQSFNYWLYDVCAFDKNANFLIAWDSTLTGTDTRNIYAQMFNNTGSSVTSVFTASKDSLNMPQYHPSAAYDTSGNCIIAWLDDRETNYAIYAQRYDKNGTVLGTNFRVSDDMGGFKKYYPKVATDESGNFIIAWVDDRTGNTNASIYAQRYDKNGTAIGSNFKINGTHPIPDTISGYYGTVYCDIKLHNGKIYTTWPARCSQLKSTLIWANILDWANPIQISDINNPSYPNSLRCGLAQNYPNPFTTATTIKYSLPKDDHVSLSVYTLAGRNIKQLVAGKKGCGELQCGVGRAE